MAISTKRISRRKVQSMTVTHKTTARLAAGLVLAGVMSIVSDAGVVFNGAVPNGAAPSGQTSNGWGPNAASSNGWGQNGWGSNGYASITPVALGAAGLQYNALLTNRTALSLIVDEQLGPGIFDDPYLRLQLTDPDALNAFRYMYGCACPAGQTFTVANDSTSQSRTTTFVGELGMAPGWCGRGGQAQVTNRQRELVSACIVARVNVRGNIAPVSLRNPGIIEHEARVFDEAAVYPWKEASFYGDIFDGPQARVKDVHVLSDGTIEGKNQALTEGLQGQTTFVHMFACLSDSWIRSTGGEVESPYLQDRTCGGNESNCIAADAGSCDSRCSAPRHRGSARDLPYESCSDPSGLVWTSPVTSFLHDRCAFSPDPQTCAAWRSASIR